MQNNYRSSEENMSKRNLTKKIFYYAVITLATLTTCACQQEKHPKYDYLEYYFERPYPEHIKDILDDPISNQQEFIRDQNWIISEIKI